MTGAFERYWLDRARTLLKLDSDEAVLDALRPDVAALADLFTTERPAKAFERYFDVERRLVAYGLYYFPQAFARIRFPVADLLARGALPLGEPLRVLDVGAGAGAALLGAVELLAARGHAVAEAAALEHSQAALDALGDLAGLLPVKPGTVRLNAGNLADPSRWPTAAGGWDLVIASFAVNEAVRADDDLRAWVAGALGRLSKRGVLLIVEPALRETSERIERLRDWVAGSEAARIWAPCLHAQPCPLLAEGKIWCHAVRLHEPPASAAFLNRKLYHELAALKFSYLAVGPQPPFPPGDRTEARLMTAFSEPKGRLTVVGCAGDGRTYVYELQKRGMWRDEKERLLAVERGERIRVKAVKPVGGNGLRIERLADLTIEPE